MANYMAKVAEMLGVELDEDFKIKTNHGEIDSSVYKLTSTGLCWRRGEGVITK